MSPEQARGETVDKRADIWAFGCVLYEVLAGRRPFRGKTLSDTIAVILERDPEWADLPRDTPLAIRRLLRRCLDKDSKRRLRDIGDARLEIEEAKAGPPPDENATTVGAVSSKTYRASALALLLVGAGLAGLWTLRPTPSAREVRLEISAPPTRFPFLAISPDGLTVIFDGRAAGQSQLWLRSLDSSQARPLPGSEHGSSPFWSPDNRSIAFFADAKLKRMEIGDGSMRTLVASAPAPLGGTWNRDGTILFSASPGQPILRVSAEDGGEASPATRFESPHHRIHSSPIFLPNGRDFIFFVSGSAEATGVYVGRLDSLDTKRLVAADAAAAYSATGHLVFVRGEQLLAQPLDLIASS